MATSGHNTFQQATPNKLQCFPRAANRTRNASSPAFHPAIPLQCQLNPQNVLAAQSLIGNRAVVQLLRQQQGRDTQTTNNTHLPEPLKTNMESLSGIDLSEVQVHYHSEKPAKLNALAYAQGSNIYLEAGQEQHLPHEAWHVVQQKQGRVKPTLQMKNGISVNDNPALEKEADTIGASAMGREQGGVSLIPLQMKQTSKNQVIQFVENNDPRKVNLFDYLDSLNKERNKKVGKSIKFRSESIVEIGMITPSKWKEISAEQNIPEYVEHKIVDKINDSQRKINTIKIDPSLENGSQILERIFAELQSLVKELAEPIYANHLASILECIDELTPLYEYMHSRDLASIDNAIDKYDELAGDNINFFLEALKSEIKEELERDPNKKGLNVEIVFLDKGNEKAGLKHILTAHQKDFEKIGIKKDDIASIVMEAVTKGKIVNAQGSSKRDRGSRPIFQVTYKGKEYKIAVTIANNGYIVGANPVGK